MIHMVKLVTNNPIFTPRNQAWLNSFEGCKGLLESAVMVKEWQTPGVLTFKGPAHAGVGTIAGLDCWTGLLDWPWTIRYLS